MTGSTAIRGESILCVGLAEWDAELPTNQHHLMSRLGVHNRVLFVESLGLRRPQASGRDLRRVLVRIRRGLRGARRKGDVWVLSPLVLPFHGVPWVSAVNAWLLRHGVARAARTAGLTSPLTLWSYVPQAEALLISLKPSRVVYHCVDDLAQQKGVDATAFRAAEERFVASADLVVATSPALADRLGKLSSRTRLMPNVADTGFFSTALRTGPVDAAVDALPGPRIVFVGALVGTKLDLPLLADLADRRSDWSIVLVGPVGAGDPSTDLSALAVKHNAHLVGHRHYRDLPAVLRCADAAVIPYALNGLTRSVFPMKVYEYLAAGLPVVATPLPALAGVEDVVFASDAVGFEDALDLELKHDDPETRRERSARAAAHSWDNRLAAIANALDEVAPSSHRGSAAPTGSHQRSTTGGPPSPAARRSARLLFAAEIASGRLTEDEALENPTVRRYLTSRPVPVLPVRLAHAVQRKRGTLDLDRALDRPARRARAAVLGNDAEAPPRFLIRMDEYPHWRAHDPAEKYGDHAFGPWRDIMASSSCPHLIAVLPRLAADPTRRTGPSRELDELEVARLKQLLDDGVELGLHGLEHRTRLPDPRLHSELGHRSTRSLESLLDRGIETLRRRVGVRPRVLVPPFNTFGRRQFSTLASRFDVVTGGPESIPRMGLQPTPVVRDDAVYLPAYPPLYGTAAEVLPAVRRRIREGTGLWTPVVLHWGWESDRQWRDLDLLARTIAPYAARWQDFLAIAGDGR